jgi:hypothetical protein
MITQYENAIKAAQEYSEGLKLKAEISELSSRPLAAKFECPRKSILMIQNGLTPTDILHEDLMLIRECVAHRRELEGRYKAKTLEAVSARYHVAKSTVKAYLEDFDG